MFRGARFAGFSAQNTFSGRSMKIALAGVILIPALFAGFYLGAFLDPYINLNKVSVAVVNEDKGAVINDEYRNVGADVIEDLKEEDDGMEWNFVTAEEAAEGMKNGVYYMICTIPEDFSEQIASADTDDPEKANITVLYDESSNMLASQIGETAWKQMVKQVNEAVVEEYFENVFTRIDDGADDLQEAVDGALELYDGLDDAQEGSGTITTNLNKLVDGSQELKDGLKKLEAGAKKLNKGAKNLDDGASTLAAGTGDLANGASDLNDGLTALSAGTGSLKSGASGLNDGLTALSAGTGTLKAGADELNSGVGEAVTAIGQLAAGAQQVSGGLTQAKEGSAALSAGATQVKDGAASAASGASALKAGIDQVAGGASVLASGAESVDTGIGKAIELLEAGDTEAALGVLEQTKSGSAAVKSGAQSLDDSMGDLKDGAKSLDEGLTSLKAGSETVASGASDLDDSLGKIKDGAVNVSDGLDTLNGKTDDLAQGVQALSDGAKQVDDGAKSASQGAGALAAGAKQVDDGAKSASAGASKLSEGASKVDAGAQAVSDGLSALSDGTQQLADSVPAAIDGAGQIKSGSRKLAKGSATLTEGLGAAKDGAGELADGLEDGVEDMTYTPQQITAKQTMMSEPVTLSADYYTSVKNYGTGFSPFFIALGVWVGAIFNCFLFRPLNTRLCLSGENPILVAFANYLPMALFSVVSTLIAQAFVQFGLQAQIGNVAGYYLMGIITALTFSAILQFLVAGFGFPGRFIAVVLLTLQLTSSAGTFPIEMEPAFFNALNPYLPMTYVVEGMRQLMTGIGYDLAIQDGLIVLAYGLVFFLLTSFLAWHKRTVRMENIHPLLNL